MSLKNKYTNWRLKKLASKYNFSYEIVSQVFREWDTDLKTTECVLATAQTMSAFGSYMSPLDITKESIKHMRDAMTKFMFTCDEVAEKFTSAFKEL